MPTVAIVSYPVLEAADAAWIEFFRAQHDPQATRLAAHVTLVFPTGNTGEDVLAEISAVAAATRAIPFVMGFAKAVPDVFGSGAHVFLVADDGADRIVALHDRLYRGQFASSLRADIPFIPHVTVAARRDLAACQDLARDLNRQNRQIRGRLDSVDLLEIESSAVTSIESFPLQPLNATGHR